MKTDKLIIKYSVKGIKSFVPFTYTPTEQTKEELNKVSDDELKSRILKESSFEGIKTIEDITIHK